MIIIINSLYPYEGGEFFLHNEIVELSHFGEKIVLYPIGDVARRKQISSLPKENVIVRKLDYRFSVFEDAWALLRAIFSKSLWDELKVAKNKGFKGIRRLIWWEYYSNKVSGRIIKDISGHYDDNERIVFYSYWMHIHAYIAYKLKLIVKNAIFISRCHGYDLYEERSAINYLPFRKTILWNADTIFSISENGIRYIKNKYGENACRRIVCSRLGTNDHGLGYYDYSINRIVSCSFLIGLKRVNLIIDALSLIKDIKIEWIHYGTGELENEIKALIEKKLPSNISYKMKGYIPNDRIMTEYKNTSYKLFINTSEVEGVPVSIMEAMSFGIPVLATDVGGTSEIVEDGYNGFLIDKEAKPEIIAERIRYMLTINSMEYYVFRKNSRKTWEQKCSAMQNYNEFYKTVREIDKK